MTFYGPKSGMKYTGVHAGQLKIARLEETFFLDVIDGLERCSIVNIAALRSISRSEFAFFCTDSDNQHWYVGRINDQNHITFTEIKLS